jgi:protein SOK2
MHHAVQGESIPHPGGEEEAEHDNDAEYTHDTGAYDANRAPYSYNAPPVAPLPSDHAHLSPEMTSAHTTGSGRATPRSAGAAQSYYSQPGYSTPPRVQQPSSNLYNVVSSDRGPANGAPGGDVYAPPADMGGALQNGYSNQQPVMNGVSGGMKRGRDDEDDRPAAAGAPGMAGLDLKRRKTMIDGPVPSPTYDASMNRPASGIAAQRRR